jgi:hypothetical protein
VRRTTSGEKSSFSWAKFVFSRNNKAVYKEAHFDGKVLRVKSPSTKKPLPAKGGYS